MISRILHPPIFAQASRLPPTANADYSRSPREPAIRSEHLGLAIVTKDADFRQRSFLLGHPPKIVWLRTGNCSTKLIENLIRHRSIEIGDFLADNQKSFLVNPHHHSRPARAVFGLNGIAE
jgi:hypothetical protein